MDDMPATIVRLLIMLLVLEGVGVVVGVNPGVVVFVGVTVMVGVTEGVTVRVGVTVGVGVGVLVEVTVTVGVGVGAGSEIIKVTAPLSLSRFHPVRGGDVKSDESL